MQTTTIDFTGGELELIALILGTEAAQYQDRDEFVSLWDKLQRGLAVRTGKAEAQPA